MAGAVSSVDFPYVMRPNGWERIEDDLIDMVNTAIKKYHGDRDRVYLSGISYGANGTWYMAGKYPEVWAAICPIAAWGHPDLMTPIAEHHIPVWCFAGGRDPVYALKYYYAGLNKLEVLGDKEVLFTVHEDMGHDVWKRVYAGEDMYTWLLSKNKN
jgi:predicted peptidase